MKTLIFAFILLFTSVIVSAQNSIDTVGSRPLESYYINFLGYASLISLNYEKIFVREDLLVSSKIGLGYNQEFQLCIFKDCSAPENYLTIPHHITGILGKGKHFFELGLGGTIIIGSTRQPYLFYPIAGYRFLPLESNNFNFRIFGQIPFTGMDTRDILFIPCGLSVGISF